jgi:hypothetical protein
MRPGPGGQGIDVSEFYGQLCEQAGRFRRLAAIAAVTGHGVTAIARGADDAPWFAAGLPPGQAGQGRQPDSPGSQSQHELVLGSPGLANATLQVIQACVPHRRLVPASCESVTFSGSAADGPVTIRATEVVAAGPGHPGGRPHVPGATVPVPRAGDDEPPATLPVRTAAATAADAVNQAAGDQRAGLRGRAGPGETTWDVDAVDAAGRPLIGWRRLVMRDAGPLTTSPAGAQAAAAAAQQDPAARARRKQQIPSEPRS